MAKLVSDFDFDFNGRLSPNSKLAFSVGFLRVLMSIFKQFRDASNVEQCSSAFYSEDEQGKLTPTYITNRIIEIILQRSIANLKHIYPRGLSNSTIRKALSANVSVTYPQHNFFGTASFADKFNVSCLINDIKPSKERGRAVARFHFTQNHIVTSDPEFMTTIIDGNKINFQVNFKEVAAKLKAETARHDMKLSALSGAKQIGSDPWLNKNKVGRYSNVVRHFKTMEQKCSYFQEKSQHSIKKKLTGLVFHVSNEEKLAGYQQAYKRALRAIKRDADLGKLNPNISLKEIQGTTYGNYITEASFSDWLEFKRSSKGEFLNKPKRHKIIKDTVIQALTSKKTKNLKNLSILSKLINEVENQINILRQKTDCGCFGFLYERFSRYQKADLLEKALHRFTNEVFLLPQRKKSSSTLEKYLAQNDFIKEHFYAKHYGLMSLSDALDLERHRFHLNSHKTRSRMAIDTLIPELNDAKQAPARLKM